MGRQIGFFMTEADEAEFFAWLHAQASVVVEHACTPSEQAELVDHPSGALGMNGDRYYLWRPAIEEEPKRVPVGDRFCIDTKAQAVEFVRVGLCAWGPQPGRIYLYTDVAPSSRLMRWYQEMAGWIRRRGRADSSGRYWGPDADRVWPADAMAAWDILRRANALASGAMPERALGLYGEVAAKFADSGCSPVRAAVARGLVDQARTLVGLGRSDEARELLKLAMERTRQDSLVELHEEAAGVAALLDSPI